MTQSIGILAATLALATAAHAQYPGQFQGQNSGGNYPTMPGSAGIAAPPNYRPPLSPYLNLLRGGDPAINYFYAVRPALMSGVSPMGSMSGGPQQGFSQLRSGFLPAAGNPTQEPVKLPAAGAEVASFPSAAHLVSFGGLNRGPQPGGGRSGILSSQPPPPARRANTATRR